MKRSKAKVIRKVFEWLATISFGTSTALMATQAITGDFKLSGGIWPTLWIGVLFAIISITFYNKERI
jgi:hypothetical protein